MQYILSILLFLIAAFLVVYSLYALKYRSISKISHTFAGFMFMLAVYAVCYGGELLSSTLEHMIFWNTLEYIGISFIPLLWINLTTKYVAVPFFRTRLVQISLLSFSCITLFGALTDPFLHLKYEIVFISNVPGFPVLGFTRGPLYYFHVLYILGAFITGIILLSHFLLSTGKTFRKTLLLMIAGSSLPCVNYVLYLINIRFPGIDTIPFSMFFSVLCFGLAVFSENFLDTVPVARSRVFETLSDAVIVIDTKNRILDYNKVAYSLFPNITKEGIPDQILLKTVDTVNNSEFQTNITCNGETRRYNCQISNISALPGQQETPGKILLLKDITDSVQLLEKMKKLATIDFLTNLYNRRYFMDQAEQTMTKLEETGGKLAFIIADLDLFKQINDTRGHLAGDAAIKAVATKFSSSILPPNLVGRFGGEEFICLLPNTDCTEAFVLAEQIRKKIEQIPYPSDIPVSNTENSNFYTRTEDKPFITASFGVAASDKVFGKQTITVLISRADKALYKSKNSGRNRTTIG